MSKRKSASSAESANLHPQDAEVLAECEYLSAGGWRTAVMELVYHLRVFRGHWMCEADNLERLALRIKQLPLAEELDALEQVSSTLMSILGHPTADLSAGQQKTLDFALGEAIRCVDQRRCRIPEQIEAEAQTIRAFGQKLRAIRERDNELSTTPAQGTAGRPQQYGKAFAHVKKRFPQATWQALYRECVEKGFKVPVDFETFKRTMQAKLKKERDAK